MARKKLLYISILLFLLSCQERNVNIDLLYDGDKLVMTSHLLAGSPLEVYLEHTFKPLGPIPEKLTVSNASVYLIKDGRDTTMLTSNGNGSYLSNLLIEAGSRYVVRATAPGFDAAQSKSVIVPASKAEVQYKIKKNVSGVYDPQKKYALVTLYFKNIQPEKDFIVIGLQSVFKALNQADVLPINDNVAATEENCTAFYSGKVQDEVFQPEVTLFRGACMPAPGKPLSFSINTVTSRVVNSAIDSMRIETEQASKILVRVGKATQNWFDWSQIQNNQPTDIENWLSAPQKTFTNVENGYGLVYASNETLIEIEL